ncbi:MAG: hypothetical protein M3Q98_02750 [Actinomycetota bacterium]|nr:hypothetical protein [Actinomycetota bacterium]
MSKHDQRSVRTYRRHWAEELVVVFLVVAAAATTLGFVRYGTLDKNPWGYIAVAVALLGALSGMILTIAEAMREGDLHE